MNKRYLFLGGPWHGSWEPVPGGQVRDVLVPEPAALDESPRLSRYTPRRILVPGWRFLLIAFVHESERFGVLERGWVLPGFVVGYVPASEPNGPENWTGFGRHVRALHRAVKRYELDRS